MQEQQLFANITVDTITLPLANSSARSVLVDVLRLDKIHPIISGNKWYKLRYYLEEAITSGKNRVITFGGAWSNHLIATAAICKMKNLACIGIVRGEEPSELSYTLQQATEMGMQLVFVSRESYRSKIIPVSIDLGDAFIIPEGGYGILGARGAQTILDNLDNSYTHFCCAVGTGTMMAGIINAAGENQSVTGISVLKNHHSIELEINNLLAKEKNNWQVLHGYDFGGYAKHNKELLSFMNDVYRSTSIPTDIVYTSKLFYAVDQLIINNFFPAESRILIIHSGGLQGNQSLDKGTLIF